MHQPSLHLSICKLVCTNYALGGNWSMILRRNDSKVATLCCVFKPQSGTIIKDYCIILVGDNKEDGFPARILMLLCKWGGDDASSNNCSGFFNWLYRLRRFTFASVIIISLPQWACQNRNAALAAHARASSFILLINQWIPRPDHWH